MVISDITRIRLMLAIRSRVGFTAAAAVAYRAFTASPTPSGSSMSRTSERAIRATSTETPASSMGKTSGM